MSAQLSPSNAAAMPRGAPLRTLVVDDEASARRRLVDLAASEPDIVVVGECSDGLQACRDIERMAPDLVLLDVEMPELDGFGVVASVGLDRMPATIFVTAHSRYAVPAFDADAMDYLLKPFDQERFSRAIAKASARMRANDGAGRATSLRTAMSHLSGAGEPGSRLWVRCGDAKQLIRLEDVMYIRAEGNYMRVHARDGEFVVRERLAGLLAGLDPAIFRRVHRSHVVNLDHVKKRLPWFGGDALLIMSNGCRLTQSRTYRDALGDVRDANRLA
jgi:two-component system, LytTR family, response regulator